MTAHTNARPPPHLFQMYFNFWFFLAKILLWEIFASTVVFSAHKRRCFNADYALLDYHNGREKYLKKLFGPTCFFYKASLFQEDDLNIGRRIGDVHVKLKTYPIFIQYVKIQL